MENKFNKVIEVDKGPLVRWIANVAISVSGWLIEKANPYATKYMMNLENDHSTPHNQMGFFDEWFEENGY